MLVLSHHARRGYYKIKVKDGIEAPPNPESPGFKPRYEHAPRLRFNVDFLC